MSAYSEWAAQVARNGGIVGGFPEQVERGKERVAARYPVEVWGPRVNAGAWQMPDKMFSNPDATKKVEWKPGAFTNSLGYYLAPLNVQEEYRRGVIATQKETAGASQDLMNQWGVPAPFRSLSAFGRTALLIGLVVAGVFFVARSRRK